MFKMMLSISMFLMGLSGCMMQHSGASSKIRTEVDNANALNLYEDCDKLLAPSGEFKGNMFSKVSFVQGSCFEDSFAVSKLVQSDFLVIIDEGGKESKSKLYADGNDIYFTKDDKKIELGKLMETKRGTEMILSEGMSFDTDGTKITLTMTW